MQEFLVLSMRRLRKPVSLRATATVVSLLLVLLATAVGRPASSAWLESVTVRLGSHEFVIPERYLLDSPILAELQTMLGLDSDSRDLLLRFEAQEISERIAGYVTSDGAYVANINALLAVLTPEEQARRTDPERFSDLWYARGSYTDRIIEPYSNGLWFKIFREIEHAYSWAVFSIRPEEDRPVPANVVDYWVAHCLRGHSPISSTGAIVDCTTQVAFDDVMIEFDVTEENLPVLDQVKEFVKSKVISWEQDKTRIYPQN